MLVRRHKALFYDSVRNTMQAISRNISESENIPLVLAVVWTIHNYYAKRTQSPVILSQYAAKKSSRWLHGDIIDGILKQAVYGGVDWPESASIGFVIGSLDFSDVATDQSEVKIERHNFTGLKYRKDKAIWFLDSLAAFWKLKEDLLDDRFGYQRNGFFCIIYTGNEQDRLTNIKHIFYHLFQLYATNVNVFLLVGNIPYVYTYFPFTRRQCSSHVPELHVSFSGMMRNISAFQINKPFFPVKVANMWGCELRVTTWTTPPYIYVDRDEVSGKLKRLHGIEGLLISLIADRMNFTINVHEPAIKDRGVYFPNGTATGATKMIMDGETNFTIICYTFDKQRSEVTLPARSYMTVALVVGIPKGHAMSPLERLFKPFHHIVWACVIAIIVIAVVIIFTMKSFVRIWLRSTIFGQSNRIPFTNMWSSFYGVSLTASSLPNSNFGRYILAIWFIYTLVLRCAYIGVLYVVLQDGRGRVSLHSLEAAMKENYTFFTYRAFVPALNNTSHHVDIQLVDRGENSQNSIFARLNNENSKFVITVYRHSIQLYNQNPENYNRRIRTLQDSIVTLQLTFYMRKHSYLKRYVDLNVGNIISSGFLRYFETLYIDENLDRLKLVKKPVELSVELLSGIFGIYCVLLMLSSVVFILEFYCRQSSKLEKVLNFFNY